MPSFYLPADTTDTILSGEDLVADAIDTTPSEAGLHDSGLLECEDPDAEELMKVYLKQYDSFDIQGRLTNLYDAVHKSKLPSTEEWAQELYTAFRKDPSNHTYIKLNDDRKKLLSLLYSLIDEAIDSGIEEKDLETALAKVFKVRRLKRILHICVAMDRAQSLYKMELPGFDKAGMHWFCKYHFDPTKSTLSAEKITVWKSLLANYPGTGTMNKRIYFLLNSKVLGLLTDKWFAKWFEPEATDFFPKGA